MALAPENENSGPIVRTRTHSGDVRRGGGIAVAGFSAELVLRNVTLAENPSVQQFGVNLDVSNTTSTSVRHSILSNGDNKTGFGFDEDYSISDGYNIDSGDSSNFAGSDLVDTDPLLGALAANGGPTPTRTVCRLVPGIAWTPTGRSGDTG